ncbi:circadian clock KaiB family protein [Leptodesmis sichuanensis]|uniref:circadian clock KaiB family protein n=1 Tax=Leptodesmis sichuanensis TaxID=2906798 RepID=UPI001F2FD55D|nr:circadian clock KaiB family protein [Leptodesmis sichuanensis]UIE37416.1 circadian clock KaiB family protein [Leptodesmis sichuanensis A121]
MESSVIQAVTSSFQGFKGIALFTPGGDLVYCIDLQKQAHWHIHLCEMLQHWLGLQELPHFLVTCYAATVDRTVDPVTGQVQQVAEASPLVMQYQPLLNAVFGTAGLIWHPTPLRREVCDPMILSAYRREFPQLWECHDLILRYDQSTFRDSDRPPAQVGLKPVAQQVETQGYVLRLFVAGHSTVTERILQKLYHLLEQVLDQPYSLKVIDVAQHPEQAELDQITATPTLVRVWPQPVRRIVGNLENVEQLLGLLNLIEE